MSYALCSVSFIIVYYNYWLRILYTANSPHISPRANTAIIRPGAHVRVGEDN